MLQWCEPLDDVFAEVRRVLKPQGFLTFTTFGPDTLKELRSAWAEADTHNHVNRFLDMHDVGDALVRAGLQEPVLDVDRTQLTYSDGMALMRDLKCIGARNATAGRPRSLLGRARLQRALGAYEAFRKDGRLPATYEIVYGAAWGTAGRPAASAHGGEVRISPAAIRRRK
jgi:malonyl-CoA O-methyltransferase